MIKPDLYEVLTIGVSFLHTPFVELQKPKLNKNDEYQSLAMSSVNKFFFIYGNPKSNTWSSTCSLRVELENNSQYVLTFYRLPATGKWFLIKPETVKDWPQDGVCSELMNQSINRMFRFFYHKQNLCVPKYFREEPKKSNDNNSSSKSVSEDLKVPIQELKNHLLYDAQKHRMHREMFALHRYNLKQKLHGELFQAIEAKEDREYMKLLREEEKIVAQEYHEQLEFQKYLNNLKLVKEELHEHFLHKKWAKYYSNWVLDELAESFSTNNPNELVEEAWKEYYAEIMSECAVQAALTGLIKMTKRAAYEKKVAQHEKELYEDRYRLFFKMLSDNHIPVVENVYTNHNRKLHTYLPQLPYDVCTTISGFVTEYGKNEIKQWWKNYIHQFDSINF